MLDTLTVYNDFLRCGMMHFERRIFGRVERDVGRVERDT
jgi:hypothetical protein